MIRSAPGQNQHEGDEDRLSHMSSCLDMDRSQQELFNGRLTVSFLEGTTSSCYDDGKDGQKLEQEREEAALEMQAITEELVDEYGIERANTIWEKAIEELGDFLMDDEDDKVISDFDTDLFPMEVNKDAMVKDAPGRWSGSFLSSTSAAVKKVLAKLLAIFQKNERLLFPFVFLLNLGRAAAASTSADDSATPWVQFIIDCGMLGGACIKEAGQIKTCVMGQTVEGKF